MLVCLNFTLESKDLSFWYIRKKLFLWTMAIAQEAENHSDEWGSTWYFLWGLNPLTKFARSSRSTELKDILPWYISQIIPKTIPVSTRIVISYAMKRGILLWIWWKVNPGFYPSTFLQPKNGSKNSILNWVLTLNLFKYFFVCLSRKTLERYSILLHHCFYSYEP